MNMFKKQPLELQEEFTVPPISQYRMGEEIGRESWKIVFDLESKIDGSKWVGKFLHPTKEAYGKAVEKGLADDVMKIWTKETFGGFNNALDTIPTNKLEVANDGTVFQIQEKLHDSLLDRITEYSGFNKEFLFERFNSQTKKMEKIPHYTFFSQEDTHEIFRQITRYVSDLHNLIGSNKRKQIINGDIKIDGFGFSIDDEIGYLEDRSERDTQFMRKNKLKFHDHGTQTVSPSMEKNTSKKYHELLARDLKVIKTKNSDSTSDISSATAVMMSLQKIKT